MMKKIILACLLLMMLAAVQESYAQLPSVTLKTMDGQNVSTDTLSNGGRPFIISFFATWCKPCNRELDAISEVYADWQKDTGVKIIAVSIDQAQNIAVSYVNDDKIATTELHTTLMAVLDDLKEYENIFQCHRSFVVNVNNITSAKGNSNGYQLTLGTCMNNIPVSRSYVPRLKSFIT